MEIKSEAQGYQQIRRYWKQEKIRLQKKRGKLVSNFEDNIYQINELQYKISKYHDLLNYYLVEKPEKESISSSYLKFSVGDPLDMSDFKEAIKMEILGISVLDTFSKAKTSRIKNVTNKILKFVGLKK
jgi:hypothetical protein